MFKDLHPLIFSHLPEARNNGLVVRWIGEGTRAIGEDKLTSR